MTRTCTTTAPPIPATRVETELGLKGHSRYQGTGSKPAAAREAAAARCPVQGRHVRVGCLGSPEYTFSFWSAAFAAAARALACRTVAGAPGMAYVKSKSQGGRVVVFWSRVA